MTEPHSENGRRAFTSRTPVNENREHAQYRRGFVTRHQVSGWRFVMRRISSGVALHDTRMLVDPLRTQSRSVLVGVLVVITGVLGCFIFSLIRPAGVVGTDPVLADRSSAALYVRAGDRLHPVLNLTSARLIAGEPVDPTMVKSSALDEFPRGNLIGIPGAPERMVQNTSADADWTVCDALAGPDPGVTAIAGPLAEGGQRAAEPAAGQAVLVVDGASAPGRTWLLWEGRRSAIDMGNRAVTDALGLGVDIPAPRPIAEGLFNAIPEGTALVAPDLPEAGSAPRFLLPVSAPVGAVVTSSAPDTTIQYYAVLPDGLQPIPPVLAAILRNTNSHGLDTPPRLDADQVAVMPVADLIDVGAYPAERVRLIAPDSDPVVCAHWSKPGAAAVSSLTLLSGSALPLADDTETVELVGSDTGGVADRVALTPGSGYFVQTVGQESAARAAGAQFWIADTGVRYGLDAPPEVLGLTSPPQPVPWAMLSLFAPGPTLSRADALLTHDGLAPDPNPGSLIPLDIPVDATQQETP